MERAIELALEGVGYVNPNPLVGAVIVKDGKIIGEGYHARYGDLHAERMAINNATEDTEGAEMYVTLEPCSHTGHQPPCINAILEAGIKRVYVGSDDPNPLVNGKGVFFLRQNGVEVVTHVMEEECNEINYVFFHYIKTKTPYVIMKYAMTMDGKIASKEGDSKWISCDKSREVVHQMRHRFQAVMCGIDTVLTDDPLLNCRMIENGNDPIRIICDSNLRIPLSSQIVSTADKIKTFVVASDNVTASKKLKVDELKKYNVGMLFLPSVRGHLDLRSLMSILGKMRIDSILLEGGGNLNYSMLENDLINEVRVFIAPKMIGGKDAITPAEGPGIPKMKDAVDFELKETGLIGDDIYARYIRREE